MSWLGTTPDEPDDRFSLERVRDHHHLAAEAIQAALIVTDVVLIVLAAVTARFVYAGIADLAGPPAEQAISIGLFASFVFVVIHWLRGGYDVAMLPAPLAQAKAVAFEWIVTFFILGWATFLMKASAELSRGTISVFFVGALISLPLAHGLCAGWLSNRFARARLSLRRVALVTQSSAVDTAALRERMTGMGIDVVSTSVLVPVGGSYRGACQTAVEEVRSALTRAKLDAIYFFLPWQDRRLVEELTAAFGPTPVPIYFFADREIGRLLAQQRVKLGNLQGFELRRAPLSRTDRIMKRLLDIAVASTALALLLPILLLTSIAILVETGRPVLFRQQRKGFGARPFAILKFRSMTVQENGSVVTQATKGDARVTRLGAILRKSSIDELPQLINVLKGDMSIVGPRPHAVAHDDYYDQLIATYAFRQHVKPGITGWAQVNGHRGETRELEQMSARVEHDLWYINNWSFWLDVKIILMTAVKVLADESAY